MFSATFPADYSSLSPISILVRDIAERIGFDEKRVYDIELAIDEACSNIIDHAYLPGQQGEMTISMATDQNGMTIVLSDQGQPFNPNDIPAPDLISDINVRQERGLGVFLVHQLMDYVHYEVLPDNTNQLTLKKNLTSGVLSEKGNVGCKDDVLPVEALQLTAEINRSISSIVDLEELMGKVTDLIQKTLDYPSVHLFLYDYVPQKLVYASGSGHRAAFYAKNHVTYDFNANRGLIPLAAKSGRYQLSNDLSSNPWHQPEAQTGTSSGSELCLPLLFHGNLLGVLDIQSDQTSAFEEQDVNLLESLSITLSVAIRNAQLFKAQEWRRKLAESYRETAEMLTKDTSLDAFFEAVPVKISSLLPVDFVGIWLLMPDDEGLTLKTSWHSDKLPDLAPSTIADRSNWFHPGNFKTEAIDRQDNDGADIISDSLGMGDDYSAVAAPISSEGRFYGVLTLHTNSHGRYGIDSRNICSTFADYLSSAVDKELHKRADELSQRTEQELQLARRIQKTFLPSKLPKIPGYDLAFVWHTARQVGGDFYDVFDLNSEKMALVVADVSDKGLPASLYMTVARTLIRAIACDFNTPAATLQRVNELLQLDSTQSFFVTLVYMTLDIKTGHLTYSAAGHPPPILIKSKNAEAHILNRGGIALGITQPIELTVEEVNLEPGDSVFLYTDGITETHDQNDKEYGSERLRHILQGASNLSAQGQIATVIQDMDSYKGNEALEDDYTVLVLKRK